MDNNIDKILKIIRMSAQITLANGGETYRAEEICKRICNSKGYKDVEALAITTGIFITVTTDTEEHTAIVRIKKRTINLEKLNQVNNISRQVSNSEITLDEAISKLNDLELCKPANQYKTAVYGGLSAGCFTVLFGGGFLEFTIALFSGIIVQLTTTIFEKLDSYQFFISIIGGMITAILAILSTAIIGHGNYEQIIIGGIMPLLPGLAMTNAIRDTIRGDLISGIARGVEAILVAASAAAGVGIIITFFMSVGGLL